MEIRAPYALIGLFVLAAIGAVFGFVYWLNNTGGLSSADRLSSPLREHRRRDCCRARPFCSTASASGRSPIFSSTPTIRARCWRRSRLRRTRRCARIPMSDWSFKGLTGVPVITLEGRSNAPAAWPAPGEPRVLAADPLGGSEHDAGGARCASPRRQRSWRRIPSRCARRSPISRRSRRRSRAIPIVSMRSWPAWSA